MLLDKNREDYIKYHDERFAELPQELISESVDALKRWLDDDTKQWIAERYARDNVFWIGMNHHGFGTQVRNFLRDTVCLDEALPGEDQGDKNWDNYYIYLLEIAAEVREWKPS